MKIKYAALFLLVTSSFIFPQQNSSFQISGGVIMPLSSSKGVITTAQYNYKYNSTFSFYGYTGYGAWDRFRITYIVDSSPLQKQTRFEAYYANKHRMIPLGIGTKINIHTSNWAVTFLNLEMNYTHLSYVKPTNFIEYDPNTLVVKGVYATLPEKKISENLLGFAFGLGVSHSISQNLDLILSYKLNSFVNMDGYSFLSNRALYSLFSFGCGFHI